MTGLLPRSPRPKTSPTRTGEPMTTLIVTARKTLEHEGWDKRAWSIHARLRHDGISEVPSARTIHRVPATPRPDRARTAQAAPLVLAGDRVPRHRRRWQIDAFEHTLADPAASVVVVFEILA